MIPSTFEDWKSCITEKCKIELTPEFAYKRLEILKDKSHKESKAFSHYYGVNHWQNVIHWYTRILDNT